MPIGRTLPQLVKQAGGLQRRGTEFHGKFIPAYTDPVAPSRPRSSQMLAVHTMIETLAWPAVGLILGLVALFLFRGPLVRMIDRITRAGKDGVSFERPQDPELLNSEAMSFEELMKQPISATVLEREKFVTDQLSNFPLKTETERISVLKRALAAVNIDLEYTRIAHIIFGSQLNFLVKFAGTRNGLPKSLAETTYSNASAQFPELYRERPFEAWLAYLLTSNLLAADGNRLNITQYGSDFLKYLVDARLAYDRHG